MKRLRFLTAVLIAWLLFICNIERLSGPTNISGTAYIFIAIGVIAGLTLPWPRRIPTWALLVTSALIYLLVESWGGGRGFGAALPMTITEICAIVITLALTRLVSIEISEFEQAVAQFTLSRVGKPPESLADGQSEIYREVQRARDHQRPLMLLVVHIEEESIAVAIDRMVQEVQQTMMKQYVLSGVAKVLCAELKDYDTIAQNNDRFLILLPETTPEKLPALTNRLRHVAAERLGVTLRIGAAALPDDALTLVGLTETAIRAIDAELERPPQPQRSTAEQRITQ